MARDLVGADRCSIWLIDSKTNQLWTKVAHGVDELRIPMGQGMVGACIAENTAIVVNDTSTRTGVFCMRWRPAERVCDAIRSFDAAARS